MVSWSAWINQLLQIKEAKRRNNKRGVQML
jgi:hypothetical protein